MGSSIPMLTDQQLSVPQYYEGRSIFVTGGTGFMGKVLLEKLLRSCPGLCKIYVLARSKRGESPQNRIEQMLKGPLFRSLAENQPNVVEKLIPISGDIAEPNLGISPPDEEIIANNVSVIIHLAATVRFDEELPSAITFNVKGTQYVIELAKKMKNLSSFVHVSTAYSHCYKSWNLDEKMQEAFYPMPRSKYNSYSPDELIDIYNDAKTNGRNMTQDILGVFPNTYTFTKAWAESIIEKNGRDLPVIVMRPSIVSAAWKAPVPGWVDNLNGPAGCWAGFGSGLMQTMHMIRDRRMDLIPVDIACDMLCVLPWKVGCKLEVSSHQSQNSVEIYNCTSGESVPVTYGELMNALHHFTKYPLENMVWYPYACFNGIIDPCKSSKLEDRFCRVLFHWIPAYGFDMLCYVARLKTVSRVKLTGKMTKMLDSVEYFATHEWYWDTNNVELLYDSLDEMDQHTFQFTFRDFEGWNEYLESALKGLREFAMKHDPSTIDICKKNLKLLYIIHQIWIIFLLGMVYVVLSRAWEMFM